MADAASITRSSPPCFERFNRSIARAAANELALNLRENTDELTLEKQKLWSEKGLETKLIEVTPGTTTYAIRYPLRPGIESYSVDGKKISIPVGNHQDHDAGVVGLVNYPNFWMDAVSDYARTMRVTPVNASTTDVEFCWLVDKNAEEGKDYSLERLTQFWQIYWRPGWEIM